MPSAQFVRTHAGFSCYDADAQKLHAKFAPAEIVWLSIGTARSRRQNSMFHALCAVIAENHPDRWASMDEAKDAIKLAAGKWETEQKGEYYAIRS